MRFTRREFLPYIPAYIALLHNLVKNPSNANAQDETLEDIVAIEKKRYEEAKNTAESFFEKLKGKSLDEITSLDLEYTIHLKILGTRIHTKMTTNLRKDKDSYIVTLNLHDIEGENETRTALINFFGRILPGYWKFKKAISKTYTETFTFNENGFHTKSAVTGKKEAIYKEEMRIDFDYEPGKIILLHEEEKEPISIPYDGELGPMTALIQYYLYGPSQTEITTINLYKEEGKREFESQTTEIRPAENKKEYKIMFKGEESLAGLFEGDLIFEHLYDKKKDAKTTNTEFNPKVPFYIQIPAVLTEKKKIMAENLKVYLTHADVN